jgi:hypothetical protein
VEEGLPRYGKIIEKSPVGDYFEKAISSETLGSPKKLISSVSCKEKQGGRKMKRAKAGLTGSLAGYISGDRNRVSDYS